MLKIKDDIDLNILVSDYGFDYMIQPKYNGVYYKDFSTKFDRGYLEFQGNTRHISFDIESLPWEEFSSLSYEDKKTFDEESYQEPYYRMFELISKLTKDNIIEII